MMTWVNISAYSFVEFTDKEYIDVYITQIGRT